MHTCSIDSAICSDIGSDISSDIDSGICDVKPPLKMDTLVKGLHCLNHNDVHPHTQVGGYDMQQSKLHQRFVDVDAHL